MCDLSRDSRDNGCQPRFRRGFIDGRLDRRQGIQTVCAQQDCASVGQDEACAALSWELAWVWEGERLRKYRKGGNISMSGMNRQ